MDTLIAEKPEMLIILGIFLFFAILETIFTQFFNQSKGVKGDWLVEVIGSLVLTGFTQPFILFMSFVLCSYVAPGMADVLSGIHFLAAFGLFLVFDDMTQYWWHRITHMVPWLYNLHRPHHNAEYLSIRVVYRNNIFYYFLMPSIWMSGALIYLGLGHVYAVFIIIKMLVITGAHSDVRWDAPLYKIKWLSPIMWVVERTISTPATHSAHHGKHASDGVTNYKGNYGNLLFFWDVLFGTAKITRQYPAEFGVEDMPETSVGEQLLWPLVKAKQSTNKN